MQLKRQLGIVLMVLVLVLGCVAVAGAQDYDLGGRTITFVGWVNPLPVFDNEGGLYYGRLVEAQEKFNVRFNYITAAWANATEVYMSRYMAGESTLDIWEIDLAHFWSLVSKGALAAADEFLPQSYFDEMLPERKALSDELMYNGHRYAFDHWGSNFWQYWFVYYNKDLFEREGLPDLQELVENGEWTWSRFLEIAKAATRDTDGDGTIDQWGFGQPWAIDPWILSNGARYTKNIDGRRVFTAGDPDAIEALNFIKELGAAGVSTGDAELYQFAAGKVAMNTGQLWRLTTMGTMNDAYGIVPLPMGPSATDYSYPTSSFEMYMIPANSADAEAVAAVLNFLFPKELWEEDLMNQVMSLAKDRESAKVLMGALEGWSGESYLFSGLLGDTWNPGSLIGGALSKALSGEATPAAAMDAIKQEAQARLDELFGL
jgi:multiple sugar transport system substrate-binding protein